MPNDHSVLNPGELLILPTKDDSHAYIGQHVSMQNARPGSLCIRTGYDEEPFTRIKRDFIEALKTYEQRISRDGISGQTPAAYEKAWELVLPKLRSAHATDGYINWDAASAIGMIVPPEPERKVSLTGKLATVAAITAAVNCCAPQPKLEAPVDAGQPTPHVQKVGQVQPMIQPNSTVVVRK